MYTLRICSQEGTGVEPTREAKDREEDPSTPGDVRELQSWRRNISRGMRQKALQKIGLGGAF